MCIPPHSVLPGLRLEKRSPCFEMSLDQLATHGFYQSCKKAESHTGWLVSESSVKILTVSLTLLARTFLCLAPIAKHTNRIHQMHTKVIFVTTHHAITEQLRAAGTAHHGIKHNRFHLDSSLMIPRPLLKHFLGWCLSHRGNTSKKPDSHLFSPP